MADHDLERRKMDEEFRRQLAERLKALEVGFEVLRDDLKQTQREIIDIKMSQLDLHYTLFGGPKADDQGLLERFRKLLYKFGIGVTFLFGVLAIAGKLIEPLYDKIVSSYLYNSVSEKWLREQSRPKVRHYTINEERGGESDGKP